MPEKIRKNDSGGYTVTGPHGTHAKNSTKENAEAQVRLLNAVEHGFKPTGKKRPVEGSPAEERGESPAKEKREQRVAGATRGNRSGGEMGDYHDKRSKY